jgi:hypothetical protein
MSLTEISLLVTTLVAIMGGIWAIFRERNKPASKVPPPIRCGLW